MRATITILTILICTTSYGQLEKLRGTWITPEQDLIFIGDTLNNGFINSNKLSNRLLENKYVGLNIHGDTLNFQDIYLYNDSIFRDPFDFKIILNDKKSLVVKPISRFSKRFFQDRILIKFTRQEFTTDTTIKFEKIVYHNDGDCFMSCPRIYLEIDHKKNIYLEAEYFKNDFKRDSLLSGNFTGILSKTMYFELIHLIQTCNLRTLSFDDNINIDDAPQRTMIIYFNGQRKYLMSKDPPFIVDDLIKFLENVNIRAQLTRTYIQKEFEW